MRLARGISLAVAIALAAGRVQGGDPDVADLLFKKAKKAFAAKSYEEAEAGFRRALQELSPFPEARFALAETFEKLERQREALEAYRACVSEIENAGDPTKWRSLKSRAQQALTRLQGRQTEITRLNEAFIRKYLDFGKKHAASDPKWAKEAFETVLLLDPGNDVAKAQLKLLAQSGASGPSTAKPKPPSERFGESVVNADLWSGADEWSVQSDTIVGDTDGPGRLFWLEEMPLEGRFGVRGRFRVTRPADRYLWGIFLGSDGREPWWGLFLRHTGSVSFERCEEGGAHIAKEMIVEGLDPTAWHTLQLDVQPGDITVTLDGKRLFEFNESNRKTFDGKLCLFVQKARIEWKELEVKK